MATSINGISSSSSYSDSSELSSSSEELVSVSMEGDLASRLPSSRSLLTGVGFGPWLVPLYWLTGALILGGRPLGRFADTVAGFNVAKRAVSDAAAGEEAEITRDLLDISNPGTTSFPLLAFLG